MPFEKLKMSTFFATKNHFCEHCAYVILQSWSQSRYIFIATNLLCANSCEWVADYGGLVLVPGSLSDPSEAFLTQAAIQSSAVNVIMIE